jgi:hypothetical protein
VPGLCRASHVKPQKSPVGRFFYPANSESTPDHRGFAAFSTKKPQNLPANKLLLVQISAKFTKKYIPRVYRKNGKNAETQVRVRSCRSWLSLLLCGENLKRKRPSA